MPPPIAIFTLAIIWLSRIGFFAFTMKESAEESGSACTRSALARIHLSISALAMSEASNGPGVQPKLPAPSISVCDHRCISSSLASGTPIACARVRAASGPARAGKRSTTSPRGSRSRYTAASFAYSGAQTDSIVLGIRRVRIVGAEQRRVVLHVFGVGGLGEEGAAHGFDPQYGRF